MFINATPERKGYFFAMGKLGGKEVIVSNKTALDITKKKIY